jgi:ribosome-binding factor A
MRSKPSKPLTQRQLKVGEHLRHILSDVLFKEDFHDEVLQKARITLSEVRISPDMRHARVYVITGVGQDSSLILKALNEISPRIRQQVAAQLSMKLLPRFYFVLDEAYQRAEQMNSLFHSPHVAQDLKPMDASTPVHTQGQNSEEGPDL